MTAKSSPTDDRHQELSQSARLLAKRKACFEHAWDCGDSALNWNCGDSALN
jgi:hypothetical protein